MTEIITPEVRPGTVRDDNLYAELLAEIDRLNSLPDDMHSCGELSCDDCNARTNGLRLRVAELEAELIYAGKRCGEYATQAGHAQGAATMPQKRRSRRGRKTWHPIDSTVEILAPSTVRVSGDQIVVTEIRPAPKRRGKLRLDQPPEQFPE